MSRTSVVASAFQDRRAASLRSFPIAGAAAVLVILGLLNACTRPFWTAAEPRPVPSEPSSFRTGELAAGRESDAPKPDWPTQASVFPGTDVVTRSAPVSLVPAGPRADGELTLNFVNTDVKEVVQTVLGDGLGATFVIDPNVKGSITFRSAAPLKRGEVLPALERMLAGMGAAIVESGGVYQILPADQAARVGIPVRAPSAAGVGRGSVVVPLQYASAVEMEKMLEPFKPAGGTLAADPSRNVILIGGNAGELESMQELIKTFDVDWLKGMSFAIYPLETTRPAIMVDNLQQIFGDGTAGPLAGMVRFVPVERMNAVLVIASRRAYLDKAASWIKRLDFGEEETARVFVYYCQNSRATDLALVLSDIFSPESISVSRTRVAAGVTPASLRTTQPRAGGTTTTFQRQTSDRGTPSRLGGTVSPAATAPDEALGTAERQAEQQRRLRALRQPTGAIGAGTEVELGTRGEIRVIADEVKNALVVLATPRDYKLVEAALRKLDIVPLQVMIEATILEVVLNDALRFGVEWYFQSQKPTHKAAFSRTGDADRPTSVPFNALSNSVLTSSFPGLTYFFQTPTASVVVNTLDRVTDVKVVSSPQLFVLDNQTGTLLVGDQVPIATRSAVSVVNPDAPVVNSVEYRDTGVILNVTPRVNTGGLVTLDIVQEVSDVVTTTTSTIDSPTIQQRKIESRVAVQNGETVALGGLIRERRSAGTEGLPYLSRIPIVGPLFGVNEEDSRRTELIVMITPRVVSNVDESRRVTQELRERIRRIGPIEEWIR